MAQYENNDLKFVAVLNRKTELPRLLNALGHISVGLTSLSKEVSEMQFLDYRDGDNGSHPAISKFPFIVLAADNGNQIRSLRKAAIDFGILHNDFVSQMLGTSAEDQLQNTASAKEAELEYFGIVLFGPAEKLNPLTKRFSLFK